MRDLKISSLEKRLQDGVCLYTCVSSLASFFPMLFFSSTFFKIIFVLCALQVANYSVFWSSVVCNYLIVIYFKFNFLFSVLVTACVTVSPTSVCVRFRATKPLSLKLNPKLRHGARGLHRAC